MPAFMLVVVAYSLLDLYQDRRLAEEQSIKRGVVMAANLAHSSRLGVFAEDRGLLESAIGSVTADADFAYAVIYERTGRILTNEAKALASEAIPGLDDKEARRLIRDGQSFYRTVNHQGRRFLEFLAPVLTNHKNTPAKGSRELSVDGSKDSTLSRNSAIGAVRLGLSPNSVDAYVAKLLEWRLGFIAVFLLLGTITIYAFSQTNHPAHKPLDRACKADRGRPPP